MREGGGLGVGRALDEAGARVVQEVEPFRVRGHEAVFDPVVDHLHEVPRARSTAVQVAELSGGGLACSPWAARRGSKPRGQRGEDRLEASEGAFVAADHEAVAALETEHAAARPAVQVVDTAGLELLRAADVVGVVRVAAVDDRVPRLELVGEVLEDGLRDAPGREHEPHRTRRVESRDELVHRLDSGAALRDERGDGRWIAVVADRAMPVSQQAARDVPSHPSEPDDAQLQRCVGCHSPSFPRPSWS